MRWTYESSDARFTPYSDVRLPNDSDVVPAGAGQRGCSRAPRPPSSSRLPARRVDGRSAVGLRLVPSDSRTDDRARRRLGRRGLGAARPRRRVRRRRSRPTDPDHPARLARHRPTRRRADLLPDRRWGALLPRSGPRRGSRRQRLRTVRAARRGGGPAATRASRGPARGRHLRPWTDGPRRDPPAPLRDQGALRPALQQPHRRRDRAPRHAAGRAAVRAAPGRPARRSAAHRDGHAGHPGERDEDLVRGMVGGHR